MSRFCKACILVIVAALGLPGARAAEPLKIGVLTDMSGVIADASGRGSVVAAELAIADAGGRVLDRPVEIVSADHQFKADIGSGIARRWFDSENVEAIFDVPATVVATGVQNIAKERGKITVISGSGTQDLFGKYCSPTGFIWTFDTAVLPRATVASVSKSGAKRWYLVGPDYTFGHEMEQFAREAVAAQGGEVVGSMRAPIGTADFSSLLNFVQGARPDVLASSFGGHDGINMLKQASEFGLTQGGMKVASLFLLLTDVNGLGLQAMQGVYTTTAFYWDADADTRAFSKRFWERMQRPPTELQAGVYSAVTHYLKSVAAAGTVDGAAVANKMRELPVEDVTTRSAHIRPDGRVMRDMYLVQVKSPAESKGPWDYYKIVATIPAAETMSAAPSPACPSAQ